MSDEDLSPEDRERLKEIRRNKFRGMGEEPSPPPNDGLQDEYEIREANLMIEQARKDGRI